MCLRGEGGSAGKEERGGAGDGGGGMGPRMREDTEGRSSPICTGAGFRREDRGWGGPSPGFAGGGSSRGQPSPSPPNRSAGRWVPACARTRRGGCWFLCLLLAIVGLSRGRGEVKDLYMKVPCVYMLASKPRGTLYVGATSDLVHRVWQHKGNLVDGFTRQYRVHRLVWYEVHESMESARAREKALKKWYRAWKVRLIEEGNPRWLDLYEGIV